MSKGNVTEISMTENDNIERRDYTKLYEKLNDISVMIATLSSKYDGEFQSLRKEIAYANERTKEVLENKIVEVKRDVKGCNDEDGMIKTELSKHADSLEKKFANLYKKIDEIEYRSMEHHKICEKNIQLVDGRINDLKNEKGRKVLSYLEWGIRALITITVGAGITALIAYGQKLGELISKMG